MWDKCMLKDMKLGTATVGLERVRREGSDRMQVPLMKNDKPNAECMGIVSLAMTFHNGNGAPPPMPMGPVVGAPAMHAASPIHGQQMPMAGYGYGMPHPGPAMGMPAGYGQEPAGYYPPQDGPPQGYPPQGYPPQGQGFQDQDQYPPPQGQGYPPQGQGGPYQQQQGAPPPGYPTGKS
ncbi:hypothetical protein FOA52_009956 [Chlamydomonas sp. UWO 241]|nr:hypothetical protein FOA52_009956 [Chlamydomonas sp. UWO 241]